MQQEDSLQQQLDALKVQMAILEEYYKRQCARRVGERLRQQLQERSPPRWRIRTNRFLAHMRHWSSTLFIGSGQVVVWLGQRLIQVGHRLDPNPQSEEDVAMAQAEMVVDGEYRVLEAETETSHEP